MPRNLGGGKNYKKRKTKVPTGPGPLTYPDTSQLYGIVLKRLGNGWVNLVVCNNDGTNIRTVLGRIRGILRKRRVRFMEGSVVIASDREFEKKDGINDKVKVDIIHKYYDEHVRRLYRDNMIPNEMIKLANAEGAGGATGGGTETAVDDDECNIIFIDEDDDKAGSDVDIDDL